VAYAIGVKDPVSVMVETFGTGSVAPEALEDAVREVFDLTPAAIIDTLKLRAPIYRPTATYGHFGRPVQERDVGERHVELFTWENTNRVEDLRLAVQRSRHQAPARASA
jgi:S-adenosylmethionine synthetase